MKMCRVLTAAAVAAALLLRGGREPVEAQAATEAWARCATGSAGAPAEPVRRVSSIRDKAVVAPAIARVFQEREREQRLSAPNLADTPIAIGFLYAAGPAATPVYYFEATKTLPDTAGLLRVSVSGWLRSQGGVLRPVGSKSELHWQELDDATEGELPVIPEPPVIPEAPAALAPLGVLSRGGLQTWVMKRQIGAGAVLVYEIGATAVRLRPTATVPGC